MPQYNPFLPAINPSLQPVPLNVAADGAVYVTGNSATGSFNVALDPNDGLPHLLKTDYNGDLVIARGSNVAFNISAAAVVRGGPGQLVTISVITAGTTVGTVNDCLTTGAAAVTNQLAPLPNTIGSFACSFPFATGLCIIPGTGQVLAVSFNLVI
jgi:hypothetical protein